MSTAQKKVTGKRVNLDEMVEDGEEQVCVVFNGSQDPRQTSVYYQEKSGDERSDAGSQAVDEDYDVDEEYDNDYAENYFDNGEADDGDDLGGGGDEGGGGMSSNTSIQQNLISLLRKQGMTMTRPYGLLPHVRCMMSIFTSSSVPIIVAYHVALRPVPTSPPLETGFNSRRPVRLRVSAQRWIYVVGFPMFLYPCLRYDMRLLTPQSFRLPSRVRRLHRPHVQVQGQHPLSPLRSQSSTSRPRSRRRGAGQRNLARGLHVPWRRK